MKFYWVATSEFQGPKAPEAHTLCVTYILFRKQIVQSDFSVSSWPALVLGSSIQKEKWMVFTCSNLTTLFYANMTKKSDQNSQKWKSLVCCKLRLLSRVFKIH